MIIELKNLSKVIKGKRLLKQVSLGVEAGSIYGLIGSDHSRKSLLIKIMLGLSLATEGGVHFFDEPFRSDMLKEIGVSIDEISFYKNFTGKENILYYLENYKDKFLDIDKEGHIEYYFKKFDLFTNMNMEVEKYSLGMLQKLRIIRALIIEPKILILDEPAKSLDPVALKALKDELIKQSEAGVTIFIATSMLDFISDLASHIGILHYGEIIYEMETDKREENQQSFLEIHSDDLPKLILTIERQLSIFDYEVIHDHVIRITEKVDNNLVIKTLIENDIQISHVKDGFKSLEEIFLEAVGD
ncbi:ABC transporter ATP-binding protein [Acidaminobacter sp. JC074]|uniref:ATP-binding cassette domain-containing protein n=1 Tax=Acidaminobacter sp. JC074 TaxID=2530199 RepID=UPI001F0F72E1|nr:ABC transporter ATP-binding protein [Acidaminobacter sp. JC074]MCH4886778.1 ABC transporter ATP-binding protein [Acidaminobacter sp. JC074]